MKNIRVFLVVLFVLFMAIAAGAQQRIGFVSGVNLATLSYEDDFGGHIDFSNRTVFGLGAVLDLSLGNNTALVLEPMYLQKGANTNNPFDPQADPEEDIFDVQSKLSYLEVPIFLKLTFQTSRVRPYVMAGPTVGLLLSSKLEVRAFGAIFKADILDLTRTINFGLGLGAGLSFPIGNNAIFVEGHYTLGLYNIAEEGKAGSEVVPFEFEEGQDLKTRGIQIMAGMTFPFGEH